MDPSNFLEVTKNNKEIESLELDSCDVGDEDFYSLQSTDNAPKIKRLVLTDSRERRVSFVTVGCIVTKYPNLLELELSNGWVNEDGCEYIFNQGVVIIATNLRCLEKLGLSIVKVII